MSQIVNEISRRRTFAIISHPDAGKTTVTEQLLLYGGAIQMAGTVKARKSNRHATSDWMTMEKERGISITSSVMQFLYKDKIINLLDTPGKVSRLLKTVTIRKVSQPIPFKCPTKITKQMMTQLR